MDAITDYGKFLSEAKTAVQELDSLQSQHDQLAKQSRQSQKQLENMKKALEDEISRTTKERLDEITSSYDDEIDKGREQIKKIRNQREKAKDQGIRERIAEETSELRDKNRSLKMEIRTLFSKDHVPGFCNNGYFYALFYPRKFMDYLQLLLTAVICFLLIPCAIYLLVPGRRFFLLAVIYFLCIVIFGGAYIAIGNRMKDIHGETLKKGLSLRESIAANERKISSITKEIRRDKNESSYDLDKYDDEISQIDQNLSDITAKKKEAVDTFESVTKNIISDEIKDSYKDKIEDLDNSCTALKDQLKELEDSIRDKNLDITDKYGSYISKDFMKPDRLDALAQIMENGTAASLSEAMQQYRKGNV